MQQRWGVRTQESSDLKTPLKYLKAKHKGVGTPGDSRRTTPLGAYMGSKSYTHELMFPGPTMHIASPILELRIVTQIIARLIIDL